MKNFSLISIVVVLITICNLQYVFAADPPYPPSSVIETVTWDLDSLTRAASGSDLFPLTWADDDHLYTAWGDGFGFNKSGDKRYLGVSRVSGPPTSYIGTDLWYETGKCNGGIICIDGALYTYVTEQSAWDRCKLWKSTDHGASWTDLGWVLDEPGGAFASPGLLQFGKDYAGARDNYVYGYGHQGGTGIELFLFRVPKDKLHSRSDYEFFAGLDGNGDPVWSLSVSDKEAVFTDPNGVNWGVNASYHVASDRYFVTVAHDQSGGWGIFDAPEPWGPWTTVAYYDNWIDSTYKFTFVFNQKWMSPDGNTVWMVFSGSGEYDSFNVIKATLTRETPADSTPPTAPGELVTTSVNESQINLTWQPSTDPESGINKYIIYRDATKVGESTTTSFSGSGLTEGITYTYEVSAVNGAGLESEKSAPISAKTLADTIAPTIISGTTGGDPNKVTVVFSEPVEQASADDISNYGIDNGITISGASLASDLKTVVLTTSLHTDGVTYTLSVNNIEDRATQPNVIAANTQVTYAFAGQLVISNLAVDSGKAYEVVENGLQSGALAYIDRDFTFSDVPASLLDATYIKTANDDKGLTGDSFMAFDVNQNVTVYVAHDNRITTKPSWMASFTDTGDDLFTTDTSFSLFAKVVSAGTVTLGGNEGSGYSMYSVIIVAQAVPYTPPVFAGEIKLAWDASPEPVSGYRCYYGLSSGNYTENIDVGKVTTYTLTGLQDGQIYYIAVRAYNDSGESNYSNEIFCVPESDDTTPPAQVSSFQATSGDSCVTLSWTNPTDDDFVGTTICYRTDGTYPTDHTDGTAVDNGNDGKFLNSPGSNDSFVHDGRQNGTSYYYSAFACNEVPNCSEAAHASATPIALDTSDPTVTITQPTSENSYSTSQSTLTVGGSASDNIGVTSVTWINSRGGSGTASGTDNWTISSVSLQEGDNVITVTAYDAAGNTGVDILTVTYTLPDTTDPIITTTSPTSEDTYSTEEDSVNLGGSASDNIGVTSVTWINSLGGSGTASGTSNWTISNVSLQEGDNVITVTAYDAAGNSGVDTLTVTYTLPDTADPIITTTSPTSGDTYSTEEDSVNLGGSASDNIGVTSVTWINSLGGSGTASGTSNWTISSVSLQEGDNVITVTAYDAAGNSGVNTLTVTYALPDTTDPIITTTSPTSENTYSNEEDSVSLGGSASDNIGVTSVTWINSRGGSGTASGTDNWTISNVSLQEGDNVITVTAHDAAGNTGVDILTVTYTSPDMPLSYNWFQAESENITSPLETVSDPDASAGAYIWRPSRSGDTTAPDGVAEYTIDIPTTGDYVIWGRVIAPDGGCNSFFTSIDAGENFAWGVQIGSVWTWDSVNGNGQDPLVFNLTAGTHTLKISGREDGTKLDRLLITNDMAFVPSEENPDNVPPHAVRNLRIEE